MRSLRHIWIGNQNKFYDIPTLSSRFDQMIIQTTQCFLFYCNRNGRGKKNWQLATIISCNQKQMKLQKLHVEIILRTWKLSYVMTQASFETKCFFFLVLVSIQLSNCNRPWIMLDNERRVDKKEKQRFQLKMKEKKNVVLTMHHAQA